MSARLSRLPLPSSLHDLPTPALVVDRGILERNLARMAARADRLGVALRPHIKTHKTVEIARRQVELGARGLTVSTLEEARVLADHGFSDLTWAFPLVPGCLAEVRALAGEIRLQVVLDSTEAFEALESHLASHPLPDSADPLTVLMEVDCGDHRSGVDPGSALSRELPRRLADSPCAPSLVFGGLLTHSGQAYHVRGNAALAAVAETERRVMVELAEALRADGLEVPTVSVGSTPAMSAAQDLSGVTEARPGNYCYYDYMQARLGACEVADCALTVVASVISRSPGHAVVDAGALALSKDPGLPPEPEATPPQPSTAARLLAPDGSLDVERWLTGLSQEHGKVNVPLPVGSRVRILPHHSCLTNACFDGVWVAEGERVMDRWKIWRER